MRKEEILARIGEWIVDGDTGMSSEYLVALILRGKPKRISHPHDPSDFNRCVKMCEFVGFPLKKAIWRASRMSVYWKSIYEHLDQVMDLYREECVGTNWRAPKLYSLMRELELEAEQNDLELIERTKRKYNGSNFSMIICDEVAA